MDHDHLPALTALLYLAPLVVLVVAATQLLAARGWEPARAVLRRSARAGGAELSSAGLLMIAAGIHAGLVPGHLDEPVLAVAFVAAAVALTGAAAAAVLVLPGWRPLSAALLVAVLASYAATRLAGLEGVDALGVATSILELACLALVIGRPARRDRTVLGM